MDVQSQFVHTLEDKAGLDEATAERVAQVAMDFGKEHGSELVSQYGPEPLKSVVPGESGGGAAPDITGAAERVSGTAGEVGGALEQPASGMPEQPVSGMPGDV